MKALVTAASKHGATLEIAEAISRALEEHGVSAELVNIDEVRDLGGYDACVVGSGIYLGNWLKLGAPVLAIVNGAVRVLLWIAAGPATVRTIAGEPR